MRKLKFIVTFIFGFLSLSFADENITITTYYPSPYGVYNELTTKSNAYLATDEGSVGIGNTSPAYKLDVGGIIAVTQGSFFYARYNNTDAYRSSLNWQGLQLGNNGSNYIVAGRTLAGGELRFVVNNSSDFPTMNGTTAMTITRDANVGIGTTSPAGKLEVVGNVVVHSNVADNCDWVTLGTGGTYLCPAGKFVAGTRDLTGDGDPDGIYCCEL